MEKDLNNKKYGWFFNNGTCFQKICPADERCTPTSDDVGKESLLNHLYNKHGWRKRRIERFLNISLMTKVGDEVEKCSF